MIAQNPRSPNVPYLRQLHGTARRYLNQDIAAQAALSFSRDVEPAWPDPWSEQVANAGIARLSNARFSRQPVSQVRPSLNCRRSCATSPTMRPRLNYLAEAYFALKRWNEGIQALQRITSQTRSRAISSEPLDRL